MSRTYKDSKTLNGVDRRERQVSARGVRREQPDLRKMSRAVMQMALAAAEAERAASASGATSRRGRGR